MLQLDCVIYRRMHSTSDIAAVFIVKVWEMLQRPQQGCMRWSAAGDSFSVIDEEEVTLLLGQYFKHANLSSFIRQLNMYNFHKRKNSQGHITFTHPLFRRHHKHLLSAIKRKPSQADILEGERLLEQLTINPSGSENSGDLKNEQIGGVRGRGEVREVLGWIGNREGMVGDWRMEKKATTIVLKSPPVWEGENVGPLPNQQQCFPK